MFIAHKPADLVGSRLMEWERMLRPNVLTMLTNKGEIVELDCTAEVDGVTGASQITGVGGGEKDAFVGGAIGLPYGS